jgi:large subunit ribosomal protein L32
MLPQRRCTHTQTRKRRSHHALQPPGYELCPECDRPKLHHAACGVCGYVNRRLSVKPREEKKE